MEHIAQILGFSLVVGFVLFALTVILAAISVILTISVHMLRDLTRRKDK